MPAGPDPVAQRVLPDTGYPEEFTVARNGTFGSPFAMAWWGFLGRLLRRRSRPDEAASHRRLGALFVRKRKVTTGEIPTCTIRDLHHATHIADRLKSQRPVAVNLAEAPEPERSRMLDFISGAAYALDGTYDQMGNHVFLFVPGNVTVADDEP